MPGARRLVDQAHAGRPQLVERGGDVVDAVGHVMQPGPARGQEAADRRVVRPAARAAPRGCRRRRAARPRRPARRASRDGRAACRRCRGGRRSRRRDRRRRPRCGRCCPTPGRVYPQRPCASPSPPTAPQAAGWTLSRCWPSCARAAPRSPASAARTRSSSARRPGDRTVSRWPAATARSDRRRSWPGGSTCRWRCCRRARPTTSRAPTAFPATRTRPRCWPSRVSRRSRSSSAAWPTGGRSSTSPAAAWRRWRRATPSRSRRAWDRWRTASARPARPPASIRCR